MVLATELLQNVFLGIDMGLFSQFLLRLAINTTSIFILIYYIFYPSNHQSDFLFTLPQMGIMVFLVASILNQVRLDFAIAMGLFAVFSILRYRTVPVELKEMTYLFSVIGISIINAMVDFKFSVWAGLIAANIFILGVSLFTENYRPRKNRCKKILTFEPTDFDIINDNNRLKQEIVKKTRIKVIKVETLKINVKRNEITVWVYYND